MPTPWDHARAALILAHLGVITIAAVPTPAGHLKELEDPAVADEVLGPWLPLVRGLGLASDDREASEWIASRGRDLVRVRKQVTEPFQPYLRYTGNAQSWRMFGGAPAVHGRFEILGRRAGETEFEPLFIQNTEHDWKAGLLDSSRVRGMRSSFAAKDLRGRYNGFSRWFADAALAEHPELDAVRVQMRTVRIPPAKKLSREGLLVGRVYWSTTFERDR